MIKPNVTEHVFVFNRLLAMTLKMSSDIIFSFWHEISCKLDETVITVLQFVLGRKSKI